MKIKLLCIGKTNFKFIDEGMELYHSRLKYFIELEQVFIPDIKNTKNMPVDEIKKKEGQSLLKNIAQGDFVCLLDERGNSFDSEGFAEYIQKKLEQNIKNLIFVVGGAYGFSAEIYSRADFKITLSKMTFSHQIIRLFFLEQLYRAFTIIKGLPYHNQ